MSEPETVTSAVAKQVPLQPLIEQYQVEFAKVLPGHVGVERFERWSVGVLRKGLAGKQAEVWQRVLTQPPGQLSVMAALMDCASLGLEPGRTYHLVPFGGEVTGITDYKGEIQLITNANRRAVVVVQLVREKDDYHRTGANIPPKHDADWWGDRGPVVGGYCYVDFGDGLYSQVVDLPERSVAADQDSCEKHKALAKTKSVWDAHPEPMRWKTLVHIERKLVPWSAEVRP